MHHHHPLWADQASLLTDLAVHDLEHAGEVQPTLVAFRDDQALFLGTLRPFEKGEYHRPVVESAAVAIGLGANRLMLSLAGRAWSTEDPIPPVSAAGDLRQRVITIHSVDGTITPPLSLNRLIPYDLGAQRQVVLGRTICEASAQGWIPAALVAAVGQPGQPPAPTEEPEPGQQLARQIRRCERLGHRFAWGPDVLSYVAELCGVTR